MTFNRYLGFDLAASCAMQFESLECRADGVFGIGYPCNEVVFRILLVPFRLYFFFSFVNRVVSSDAKVPESCSAFV